MRALSVDGEWVHALRGRRTRGFVHSVFERAVNVQDEAGELFTLASRDLDNAPGTVIADTARFSGIGLAPGDRVEATEDTLTVGARMTIGLDRALAWDGGLPSYPADDSRLRLNLRSVRARTGRRAFGAATDASNSAFASQMPELIARRTGMLRAALVQGNIDAAHRHGTALIGLGPGLTPSGDDFLVGLFAVLHMPAGPCRDLTEVCAGIAAQVPERTNAISAAALKAAARGRVRESVGRLLQALVQDCQDRVMAALSPVLAIGSTSGADMVAGILDGFDVATSRRPAAVQV